MKNRILVFLATILIASPLFAGDIKENIQQLERIKELSSSAIGTSMDSQTYLNLMSSSSCALGFAMFQGGTDYDNIARELIAVTDHIIVSGYAASGEDEWSKFVKARDELATNIAEDKHFKSPSQCVAWGYDQKIPKKFTSVSVQVK